VTATENYNFSGRLIERLSLHSCLVDAVTGRAVGSEELRRMVAAFGRSLLSSGLKQGDRVLIGCTLSVSSAVAYLGTMFAGLVAVPVDERVLTSSTAGLVAATGAKAVWTETSPVLDHAGLLLLRGDPAESPEALVPVTRAASDLAALMATSGSTGIPRFVMVSHGNLIANTEAIIPSQHLREDECAMLVLPVNYCFGASLLHSHLYSGGSVVFDRRFMFPDKVLQAMVKFACTTFAGVPTIYNALLRRSNLRNMVFPNLRRYLQAGGALAPGKIDEMRAAFPGVEFYVMYGQTEATARISCLEPNCWDGKRGSAGRPLNNLTVTIVDEEGNRRETGETGELLVKGPSVCSGYWNDPEETRRVFKNGWLHTGDLARQDEDGYLWIEGRKGSFLKIRGTRVSMAEVESRIAALPGVFECGACSTAHPEAGEALVLLVVPDREAHIDPEGIRRALPPYWTVDSIRVVSELPKTSTGKLARSELLGWTRNGYAAIA
jgi:acyl-CoA synthetase (AMP-forming)/AMP-acid ligase II